MSALAPLPRAARLLAPSPANIAEAGAVLAAGGLCAFPTETVYGLGANALNETAVRRIFEVKQRPLTDPLIVHVSTCDEALALVDLGAVDSLARRAFEALAATFWPGPLTMVCEARPHLPKCLSAGTSTVGVRCPSHPLALALLRSAGVPVAAPSANVFGHVSPTSARHVLDDLGEHDMVVLDGEAFDGDACCEHGIESTVCKIFEDDGGVVLRIFRRGAVSQSALSAAVLAVCGAGGYRVEETLAENRADTAAEAPGQLLTHYAPRLPCYLARVGECGAAGGAAPDRAESVVLDFGGRLAPLRSGAVAYRDLSPLADATQAANGLFDALRWAEAVSGATAVLVADLSDDRQSEGILAGVADRLYRAASGRKVQVQAP
ncbi:DHBP synthase RibB-like alpha/beta domain-containing protein [Pelagophyceae sp. CCMP2097]|nr:DHBP synthase RibB-like alpha/beta domain-containing protein [Pelagophyceae sp. CCMP2097]